MQSSAKTVVAGQSIQDNLKHSESGIIQVTITESNQQSLSDSYSFDWTEASSHEIGGR
mgnify:FL=1